MLKKKTKECMELKQYLESICQWDGRMIISPDELIGIYSKENYHPTMELIDFLVRFYSLQIKLPDETLGFDIATILSVYPYELVNGHYCEILGVNGITPFGELGHGSTLLVADEHNNIYGMDEDTIICFGNDYYKLLEQVYNKIGREDIKELLQSDELYEVWKKIQQDFPLLSYRVEEMQGDEVARIDRIDKSLLGYNAILYRHNFPVLSVKELIRYSAMESFKAYCGMTFSRQEEDDIVIGDEEREYILCELELSVEEYIRMINTYDILDVAETLIEYYLLENHPEALLEYYKGQRWDNAERLFDEKMETFRKSRN